MTRLSCLLTLPLKTVLFRFFLKNRHISAFKILLMLMTITLTALLSCQLIFLFLVPMINQSNFGTLHLFKPSNILQMPMIIPLIASQYCQIIFLFLVPMIITSNFGTLHLFKRSKLLNMLMIIP